MKSILKFAPFFAVIFLAFSQISYAQDSTKTAAAKDMVTSKNYVFIAQTALPLSGPTRQLTSYYDLKISNDSLISNLPYFGRAYSAPINSSNAGLNFISTNFEYNVINRKKDGWDILINLKDQTDVRQLSFTIFENGRASLRITSNNRSAISFDGYIKKSNQNE
ncbi:MAG: DUF4251 domain-containing protein [Chitinophagaceae bacterium]